MMVSRIASLGLLALLVFIPGFFAPDAGAAAPSAGFNNKSGEEDEGLGSAQGEIDQIITPEYRRRGMRVERMSNGNLRLRLPSEVLFERDSADISRDFAPTLRQVARIMSRRPRLHANVAGYTDSTGSDSHNLDLSARRAESVTSILKAEGVEGSRLHPEGRGEREPVASNNTAEGQQLNRRVEIVLYRQRGDRLRRVRP